VKAIGKQRGSSVRRAHLVTWLMMGLCVLAVWCGAASAAARPDAPKLKEAAVKHLLTLLDLKQPGLKEVAAAETPEEAARRLLAYYRARRSVTPLLLDHRVPGQVVWAPPEERERLRGKVAVGDDLEVADDAVRNKLIAAAVMPRHDFGEKIDWHTNRHPEKDIEWIYQLHRHYSWWPLGRAYWHTGDEKYAEAYTRQLADWLASCPPNHKDAGERMGYPPWQALNLGIRGNSWTSHFHYFLHSEHYTPELLVGFLTALHENARLLSDRPKGFNRLNWGLMEAEGLAFIALNFPEFREAKRWRDRAAKHLVAEVNRQVLPDGMHAELCFGYHRGAIYWLGRTFWLARQNQVELPGDDAVVARTERMFEVLLRHRHPDGRNSCFGDDHTAWDQSESLVAARSLFPENETFAYLGSRGQAGRRPPTAFSLPHAGLHSMRTDWTPQAMFLILKCGPDGGGHCHPDNGTFELSAGGRRLILNSGCYSYHDKKWRPWFRQTSVKNTLTLDGKDTAYKPKLLLWEPGEALDRLVVENGSYPGLTHRRAVLFGKEKRYVVIVDEALGAATGVARVYFGLAPGKTAFDPAALRARTVLEGGTNLLVQGMALPGVSLVKTAGFASRHYDVKEPRDAAVYHLRKGAAPVRFVTVLVPFEGEAPAVQVELVGEPPLGGDALELDLTLDGKTERVGYRLPGAEKP
jgi:heparan-sulfate lyase